MLGRAESFEGVDPWVKEIANRGLGNVLRMTSESVSFFSTAGKDAKINNAAAWMIYKNYEYRRVDALNPLGMKLLLDRDLIYDRGKVLIGKAKYRRECIEENVEKPYGTQTRLITWIIKRSFSLTHLS